MSDFLGILLPKGSHGPSASSLPGLRSVSEARLLPQLCPLETGLWVSVTIPGSVWHSLNTRWGICTGR